MSRYFPLTKTRTVTVEVPVGDGDRDISYNDSFDISEQLAGTLGPVQTQDSTDFNDEFVARELVLQESLDASDELRPIEGLAIDDSADFNDRLSGTIGPIAAPDTLDATDDPVFGPLVLGDSMAADDQFGLVDGPQLIDSADISDKLAGTLGPVIAPDTLDASDDPVFGPLVLQDSIDTSVTASSDLSATALDGFDIEARLGQITRFDQEQFFAADAFAPVDLVVPDSVAADDLLAPITGLAVGDSLDASTVANASISSSIPDSLSAGDIAVFGPVELFDTTDIADARGNGSIANARLWPNVVVSQSGMTTPNNLIDLSEATGATISITQSGGFLGGSSQTANGNIRVSCANLNIAPNPSISNAQVQWGWTTTSSGGLQNGNSVNAVIEYSINNGGSWIALETVTNDAGTGNPTANITISYAQIQALEFRVTVSVVSGTTVLTGGANQTFSMRYFRLQFNAVQTL